MIFIINKNIEHDDRENVSLSLLYFIKRAMKVQSLKISNLIFVHVRAWINRV